MKHAKPLMRRRRKQVLTFKNKDGKKVFIMEDNGNIKMIKEDVPKEEDKEEDKKNEEEKGSD